MVTRTLILALQRTSSCDSSYPGSNTWKLIAVATSRGANVTRMAVLSKWFGPGWVQDRPKPQGCRWPVSAAHAELTVAEQCRWLPVDHKMLDFEARLWCYPGGGEAFRPESTGTWSDDGDARPDRKS